MVVPQVGRLVATGDPWSRYRVLDADGVTVAAVVAWFAELQAAGRSAATHLGNRPRTRHGCRSSDVGGRDRSRC